MCLVLEFHNAKYFNWYQQNKHEAPLMGLHAMNLQMCHPSTSPTAADSSSHTGVCVALSPSSLLLLLVGVEQRTHFLCSDPSSCWCRCSEVVAIMTRPSSASHFLSWAPTPLRISLKLHPTLQGFHHEKTK